MKQMRRNGLAIGVGRRDVYCIVRVYDLVKEKIGVRLFIDPWRYRDLELKFDTTYQETEHLPLVIGRKGT